MEHRARTAAVFSANFTDIEEIATAIRVADVQFTPKATGSRAGWIASAELDGAMFQAGELAMPHLAHATIDAARVLVYLVLDGAIRVRGRALDVTQLGIYRPGAEHQHVTHQPFAFAIAAFPEEELATAVTAVRGGTWSEPKDSLSIVRPDERALRRLGRRFLALTSIARWRPDLLGATAARSMLKKDLLDLVARALGSSRPVASAGRPSSHSAIVLRVEEHLRASEGRAVTVTDLCGVAGATERTLRNAFSRVYGMGPNRFVRLHRLDEARRALRTPAPTDTVSRIATALGIWDLGRFAGQYRALFGESPSQTLERARRGRTASPTRRLPRRPSRRCESEDIRADDPPPP